MRLEHVEELEQYELRWKYVLAVSAIVLTGAALDIFLRAPEGWEAFWCYVIGAIALALCLLSASKLRLLSWGDDTSDAIDALDAADGDD